MPYFFPPYFTPWIPNNFNQIPNRILIIGESCPRGNQTLGPTGWSGHDNQLNWQETFMKIHVEENRDNDLNNFFGKIRNSFLYDGRVLEPKEFWDRHAFTNIIPRLIEGRPTDQDWQNARQELPRIIRAVKPQKILIASARAVEELKQRARNRKYKLVRTNIYNDDWWEMYFDEIPAIGIYHSSAWNRAKYTLDQARRATARLQGM